MSSLTILITKDHSPEIYESIGIVSVREDKLFVDFKDPVTHEYLGELFGRVAYVCKPQPEGIKQIQIIGWALKMPDTQKQKEERRQAFEDWFFANTGAYDTKEWDLAKRAWFASQDSRDKEKFMISEEVLDA